MTYTRTCARACVCVELILNSITAKPHTRTLTQSNEQRANLGEIGKCASHLAHMFQYSPEALDVYWTDDNVSSLRARARGVRECAIVKTFFLPCTLCTLTQSVFLIIARDSRGNRKDVTGRVTRTHAILRRIMMKDARSTTPASVSVIFFRVTIIIHICWGGY